LIPQEAESDIEKHYEITELYKYAGPIPPSIDATLYNSRKIDALQSDKSYVKDNIILGKSIASTYGFEGENWDCLDKLWGIRESGWDHLIQNKEHKERGLPIELSAYGIAQAYPGKKMAANGSDWRWNPETQIRWGLDYIRDVYSNPCVALQHSLQYNSY
jgi:hypothetical protein